METGMEWQLNTDVRIGSSLVCVSELDEPVLAKLFRDDTPIVVVKGFASEAMCDRMMAFLHDAATPTPYTHEVYDHGQVKHLYFGVDRIGTPFNSTLVPGDSSAARECYYRDALPGIRRLRAGAFPHVSPIDRLRLELDELWPVGAHIASFDGRSMFVGIVRMMRPGSSASSELHPHFDALPAAILPFDGQFSANIFMAVPPSGGELEVWDVPPFSPGGVLPDNWRPIAGEPLTVRPERGDLILFNSRKPHAIRRFADGDRVSIQTFIGYRDNRPLLLWN
jgi:hypothetical protein